MRIWVEVDGERIEVVDERISEMVKEYLKKRMQKENEHEFEFEATNDPRKGYPYWSEVPRGDTSEGG